MRDKNSLYSLILATNIVNPLLKQNKEFENYLLIDLPLPKEPFVVTFGSKEFKLTNLHITVFKKHQRPPHNFHCSGEFESIDGEKIKLRTFSGLNDKLQEPHLFTKINDEYVFSDQFLSTEYNSTFVDLSSQEALPIISQLRIAQEDLTVERRKTFEQVYLPLKEDLYERSEQIESNLHKTLHALQLLDDLSTVSRRAYKQEYDYLNAMKRALQISNKPSSNAKGVPVDINELEDIIEISADVEEIESVGMKGLSVDSRADMKTNEQPKSQKKISSLVQDFQENLLKIKTYPYQVSGIAYKFEDNQKRLEMVLASKKCIKKLQTILDNLLEYMDSSTNPDLSVIPIQKMTYDFSVVLRLHNEFCIHSLKHFLLSDVHSAASLIEFRSDLDDKFLKVLLSNDKLSSSLSFMYQNYPIDETAVETVLNKDNTIKLPILSVVYERGYVNCFRALLRDHQASPLVLDKTGLPLLHTLLQLPLTNPFRQVLQEEYKGLSQSATYRKLGYELNVYLKANPTLPIEQQEDLQQALKNYRLAQTNPQTDSIGKLYASNMQMSFFNVGKTLNPETVSNLKKSSTYTEQMRSLIESAKKLQTVIKNARLTQKFAKANKDYYAKMELYANSHSEAFANMTESNLSTDLEVMNLLNPLVARTIEIQAKLKSMTQFGKPSKKCKNLQTDFYDLQRQIKNLAPGIEKIFNHDPEEDTQSFSLHFDDKTTAKEKRKGLQKMQKHLSRTLGSSEEVKEIMGDLMSLFQDPFKDETMSSSVVQEEQKEIIDETETTLSSSMK